MRNDQNQPGRDKDDSDLVNWKNNDSNVEALSQTQSTNTPMEISVDIARFPIDQQMKT